MRPRPGVVAAALLLTSTAFFTYTHWVLSEALLMFLFLAHAYAAARALESKAALWALAAGLAVGWVTAVRITSLALVVPAVACLAVWGGRARARLLLAYGLGCTALVAPLLLYNNATFGSPLRSGYQYWCSNPYDLLSNTYSFTAMWQEQRWWFHLRHLHRQLWDGGGLRLPAWLPLGEQTWAWWSLAALVVLPFYVGVVAMWRSRRAPCRAWLVVVLFTIAATLIQYALYFITSERFLVPLLPLSYVATACGLTAAFAKRPSLAFALAAPWLLLFPLRVARLADEVTLFHASKGSTTERFLQRAQAQVEANAVIVSNATGLLVGHYLLRDTARTYVPYFRGVEYAAKYAQPAPPIDLSRIPAGKPFDHVYEGALENGARRVFAYTFLDDPAEVSRLAEERPTYFLLDARRLSAPPPGVALDELAVEGPWQLYRLR